MGGASDLMSKRHLVAEIDGVAYTYRRLNTVTALKIDPVGVWGAMESAEAAERRRAEGYKPTQQDRRDFEAYVKQHLAVCLISPRLGDVTDAEEDTVCMEDLGGDAYVLYHHIIGSVPDAANFTPSSPESEG